MQNWRRYLNPPEETLLESSLSGGKFEIKKNTTEIPKLVFWGVRGCDLKAIGISDDILINNRFVDPYYKARRDNIFIIAADCPEPAATCFCTSFDTGPRVKSGYDIALTEIEPGVLIARTPEESNPKSNSESNHHYLDSFPEAEKNQIEAASDVATKAVEKITRSLDVKKSREILEKSFNHSHWDNIASRCLACSNCTMVCPTCFCTTIDESPALDAQSSKRVRRWDSCFNISHSYIHGGHMRSSIKSRYRQWLMHKLVHWETQFQSSGCTGCGRCITWCPASIDFCKDIPFFEKEEVSRDV